MAIAGTGAVVGVAAAFWIIGRSEDREREARERKGAAAQPARRSVSRTPSSMPAKATAATTKTSSVSPSGARRRAAASSPRPTLSSVRQHQRRRAARPLPGQQQRLARQGARERGDGRGAHPAAAVAPGGARQAEERPRAERDGGPGGGHGHRVGRRARPPRPR